MKKTLFIALLVAFGLTGCGASKKNFSMKLHSDPLGAYALMQVKYKNQEDSDWIFLGPTPVVMDKAITLKGATSVSVRVIRPGFFEQTKTWKIKDFIKEHKQNKAITWIPALVQQ